MPGLWSGWAGEAGCGVQCAGDQFPGISLSLRNHLAVRDILRADPGLREQYAAVKRMAGATAADIDEYGRAKNAMVQRILAAADLTADERASIDASQAPSHDEVPR